jgi:lysophospholipase
MIKNVVALGIACAAMPTYAIDEAGFEAAYQGSVWPWFTAARKSGALKAVDGMELRWFAIEAPSERAALVVLPGWTEIGETFAEELFDLRDLGMSYYVLDHRCQGLSGSEIQPRDRWYLQDWRTYLSDVELFFDSVVRTRPQRRIVLYGNSMGGAIATSYLARHPDAAQALVLTVPMFGVNTAPLPGFAASAVARLYQLFGKGAAYFHGHGPYRRTPFDGNSWFITSRARYEQLDRISESRPEYQMGGATARGSAELLALSRDARTSAAKIGVPALLVQAGKEQVVSNRAEDRAAKAMRDCRKVVVAEAHHVIMHETDAVRGQALAAIRGFLEEQIK